MIDIIAMPRIVSFDGVGESQQLTVQGFYSDGSIGEPVELPGIQPTFTSSEPGMVQVSSDGVVAALEVGGADILVRYGEHATEVPVLVWPPDRPIPDPDFSKLVEVDDDGTAVLVNRVLAELEPGYGAAAAAELAAMLNGEVIFQYLSFPGYIIEFEASSMADLESALEVLNADDRIANAYPDQTVSASEGPTPTPVAESAAADASGFKEVRMFEAWDLLNRKQAESGVSLYREPPVVIVVIDTYFPPSNDPGETGKRADDNLFVEFDYNHLDVKNAKDRLPSGHGIAVTSILVAENTPPAKYPGVGYKGMNGVLTGAEGLNYRLYFRG